MSGMLAKVQSGQPLSIPAGDYNAFVDAALDLRQRQMGVAPAQRSSPPAATTILVRNDSGDDRERFEVLGIDVPIIDPADNEDGFKNRIALAGVTPAAGTHEGRFVILAEPIASGKIGRAYIDGVCPAWVDLKSTTDRAAEVADGTCLLTSGATGSAALLWVAGGIGSATATGEQWAVARFGMLATSVALVLVTGNAAGGGKYTGRILGASGGTTLSMSGNLAIAELGADPGEDNCYILATSEVGAATHNLTSGTPIIRHFLGLLHPSPAEDGKPVYIIDGVDVRGCE